MSNIIFFDNPEDLVPYERKTFTKHYSKRVREIIDIFEKALEQESIAVLIPLSGPGESNTKGSQNKIKYRIKSAAKALDLETEATVYEHEGYALVRFVDSEKTASEGGSERPLEDM